MFHGATAKTTSATSSATTIPGWTSTTATPATITCAPTPTAEIGTSIYLGEGTDEAYVAPEDFVADDCEVVEPVL